MIEDTEEQASTEGQKTVSCCMQKQSEEQSGTIGEFQNTVWVSEHRQKERAMEEHKSEEVAIKSERCGLSSSVSSVETMERRDTNRGAQKRHMSYGES